MIQVAGMTTAGDARKIFVLDTSVILYDANAIYSFKEHDVAIPITVLEELDRVTPGVEVVPMELGGRVTLW